jgi:phosphate transport system substrate-binding protein
MRRLSFHSASARRQLATGFNAILAAVTFTASLHAATLKINGPTTVNLPVAEAAEILRAERGMQIQVDTQGGSSGGISMLGDGLVQIGMSSKPLGDGDRGK